jgi:pyrroline-5-carboxylate reductase
LEISRGYNVWGIKESEITLLRADPADVGELLAQPGVADALAGKMLIGIVAGWETQ